MNLFVVTVEELREYIRKGKNVLENHPILQVKIVVVLWFSDELTSCL